jgi:hypothetical protein
VEEIPPDPWSEFRTGVVSGLNLVLVPSRRLWGARDASLRGQGPSLPGCRTAAGWRAGAETCLAFDRHATKMFGGRARVFHRVPSPRTMSR